MLTDNFNLNQPNIKSQIAHNNITQHQHSPYSPTTDPKNSEKEKELAYAETDYPYNDFKPHHPDVHWEPLVEIVPPKDRAHFADKSKASLFAAASKVTDLTVPIGTQIDGIKLRNLSDKQRDELALLIAERGVVFFRDQDDFTIEDQLALGRYYGILHKHPTTGYPVRGDLEEVLCVYYEGTPKPYNGPELYSSRDLIHSDVSYELQPPSYTSLKLLHFPPTGGDTLWISGYAAYDRLSYPMREFLENLTAVHSAKEQAEGATRDGIHVRRDPVQNNHPIVRTHPVTGWKSLYVNPTFTRTIVGVPKGESEAILQFLYNHIATATDCSIRFKWEKGSVAIWDNRIVAHTPILDFKTGGGRRHGLRVTPRGERPYLDPNSKSREEEVLRAQGIKIEKDSKVEKRTAWQND